MNFIAAILCDEHASLPEIKAERDRLREDKRELLSALQKILEESASGTISYSTYEKCADLLESLNGN